MVRARHTHVPSRSLSRGVRAWLAHRCGAVGRGVRGRHGQLRRLGQCNGGTTPVLRLLRCQVGGPRAHRLRDRAAPALQAKRIYHVALAGTAPLTEAVALRRHMLLEMARMSTEDGLTMTIHAGVR